MIKKMNVISDVNITPLISKIKHKKIRPKIIIIDEDDDYDCDCDKNKSPESPSCVNVESISETISKTINKGSGAGGSNTNLYGKKFEEKTLNKTTLIKKGYIESLFTKTCDLVKKSNNNYYLLKTFEDKTITFVLQTGLKKYIKTKFDIDLFRCPDEAYIIEYNTGRKIIKILEKKEQHVEGSVEEKLYSGPSRKREYELALGPEFEVYYGFCVNDFLKKKLVSNIKKYVLLNIILRESNIDVLFGDDEDYFDKLDEWINSSL